MKLIFGDAEHVLWNEDVRVSKDPSFVLLLFAHSGGKRDGRLGMLSRSRAFLVACIRQLGGAWYVGLGQMRDKTKTYTEPEVRAKVVYSSLVRDEGHGR